jgi:hypothetical protein
MKSLVITHLWCSTQCGDDWATLYSWPAKETNRRVPKETRKQTSMWKWSLCTSIGIDSTKRRDEWDVCWGCNENRKCLVPSECCSYPSLYRVLTSELLWCAELRTRRFLPEVVLRDVLTFDRDIVESGDEFVPNVVIVEHVEPVWLPFQLQLN